MFKITNILNPLTGGSTTGEYTWEKGKTLAEYVGYEGECVVGCGGKMVDKPITDVFPARKEHYTVMVVPEGMDRQSWRLLGFAAMTGVAFIPGWGAAAAFIGSNIINLALRPEQSDEQTQSQSYSWEFVSSPAAGRGLPMPVVYGKARVRPTLKNRYIEYGDDKQYLYALYSLAAHKVDERVDLSEYPGSVGAGGYGDEYTESAFPGMTFININNNAHSYPILKNDGSGDFDVDNWKFGHGTGAFYGDVVVNGRSLGEYHDDVDWETRPGLPDQTEISGFNTTYNNYTLDVGLHLGLPTLNKEASIYRRTTSAANYNCTITYLGTKYKIIDNCLPINELGDIYWVKYSSKFIIAASVPVDGFLIASYDYSEISGISAYRYTKVENGVPAQDSSEWSTLSQHISDAQNIELTFDFPQGLYDLSGDGEIEGERCFLYAQYREVGTMDWESFDFRAFQLAFGGNTDAPYRDASSGMWYGGIYRKKTTNFSVSLKATQASSPLNAAKIYEVRVTANSASLVNVTGLSGITYGDQDASGDWCGFTYPGEPLLGIKALATGQISGDLDVQVDVERTWVWVYNTRSNRWVQAAANNHAWAVYDMLAQGNPSHPAYPTYGNDDAEAVYGCGIHYSKLDYESFRTWAEYVGGTDTDELGYELNIVFDTFMTAWDAVLRVCQEGRGMVYGVGDKIYAFADKVADTAQIFTMGNIQLDSFNQTYVGGEEKANMVEATYWDASNNYQRTMISVRTSDWDSGSSLSTPATITLYGTTDYEQAVSIAAYLLQGNEYLTNTITFNVDVDAMAVQVGDVVEVQHDVLTTGQGGRIVSVDAVAGSITFDRILELTGGVEYELAVYHNNGTIERKTVTGGSDTSVIVWGAVAWNWVTEPEAYELYSFGVAGTHTNKYRVTGISRTNELMRTITLMQYDARVYEGYAPTSDVEEELRGQLSKPAILPVETMVAESLINIANNLQLQEIVSKRATGEYESSVIVKWGTELGDPRGVWEVWYRDVDADDINWQGTFVDGQEYNEGDKVELDGATFICVNNNTTSKPVQIGE